MTARWYVSSWALVIGDMVALDGEAQKIGRVADLIRDMADQTNLLALNATIHSLRQEERQTVAAA